MAKIKILNQTVPTTPDTGYTNIYVDSADKKIKYKDDTGTVGIIASETSVDSIIAASESVLSNSDYLAGEDGTKGDSLFVEDTISFSSAANTINVGDVTTNARAAIRLIGSGVSSDKIKLSLGKIGSPSVTNNIRIETEVLGKPSGTLVSNNAVGSVNQLLLNDVSVVTNTPSGTRTSAGAASGYRGVRIYTNYAQDNLTVVKNPNSSGQYCLLKTDAGVLIESKLFTNNIATFTTKLTSATYYRLEVGSVPDASNNRYHIATGVFPYNANNINIVNGSRDGTTNESAVYNILSISSTKLMLDTEITLQSPISITKGQPVWLVNYQGTYGSETINSSNYYKLGYLNNKNTTTRYTNIFDGTNYNIVNLATSVASGQTYGVYQGTTTTLSLTFTPKYNIYITTITSAQTTSMTVGGDTYTGSGTFTINKYFVKGVSYVLTVNGTSIQYGYNGQLTETNMYISPSTQWNITINSSVVNMIPYSTTYTSSTLFETKLLSKTDAKYSYKLPDIIRLATDNYTTGQQIKYDFNGISKSPTVTDGNTYYISNTPGALGTSAGTNSFKIGKGINDGLYINPITL